MTKPCKILAVSDQVLDSLYQPDVRQRYPDVDLIIGCGDLPFYYLDFLVSALNKPMCYVRGNHDAHRQYSASRGELTEVRGGYDMHCQVRTEKGLIICGLEGSMRYKPERKQQYTEREMTGEVLRMGLRLLISRRKFGQNPDILVTHSPPFGIHDDTDLAHTGFKIFLTFLRTFKPRYMLHGHVHIPEQQQPAITQYEQTKIINVYPKYTFEIEPAA